jgi:AcrR family transcriptional regulator
VSTTSTTPGAPPAAGPTGLHVRAGNTMSRTRAGLLDGAVSVIERSGLGRLTMSAVADRSGVSKATLYNHFRTKDDVLRALVLREVELMADDADAATAQARASGADLVAAAAAGLANAAGAAAEHVAARRVAAEDPGALAPLLRADGGAAWQAARTRLSALLGVPPEDPLVRLAAGWVVSQVLDPQDPVAQSVTATALARAAAQSRRGLRDPAAALEAALSGGADAELHREPGPGPG